MSLTKKELTALGWHDLGKQSPRYWSFVYPKPGSEGWKRASAFGVVRLLGLVVGSAAVKFTVLFYRKPPKDAIQDAREDANFSASVPLIARNGAVNIQDTAYFYHQNGYHSGDLDLLAESHGHNVPVARSKAPSGLRDKPRSARPMSSRSFRAAMGGPYVGEKFMVLSAVTDEPETRRVKRIVAHYPDGKWEVQDTLGDVHVLSWKDDRKNPSDKYPRCAGCRRIRVVPPQTKCAKCQGLRQDRTRFPSAGLWAKPSKKNPEYARGPAELKKILDKARGGLVSGESLQMWIAAAKKYESLRAEDNERAKKRGDNATAARGYKLLLRARAIREAMERLLVDPNRPNPSSRAFHVGDIVAHRASWLRSAGWFTNVPKNGKVAKVKNLGDEPMLFVVWSDGHAAWILAANVIHYDKRHLEPN